MNRTGGFRAWVRVAAVAGTLAMAFVWAGSVRAAVQGGGLVVTYHRLSTPQLNDFLTKAGLSPVPQQVVMVGATGYGQRGPGLYFAAAGQAGTAEARKLGEPSLTSISLRYLSATVGYSVPLFPVVSLDAGLGVAVGWAALMVARRQWQPSEFQDALDQAVQTSLTQFVAAVIPELAVSVRITPSVHLRLGAAYFWHMNPGAPWRVEATGEPVTSGPADSYSGAEYRLAFLIGRR